MKQFCHFEKSCPTFSKSPSTGRDLVPFLRFFFLSCSERWWPAEVSHPKTIPENIQRMRHDVGEFPVHFFGSNDYLWTYQARVFPYMDVDANSKEKMGKGVDATYKKGTQQLQHSSYVSRSWMRKSLGMDWIVSFIVVFGQLEADIFSLSISRLSFGRSGCTVPWAAGREGASAASRGQEERQEASSV